MPQQLGGATSWSGCPVPVPSAAALTGLHRGAGRGQWGFPCRLLWRCSGGLAVIPSLYPWPRRLYFSTSRPGHFESERGTIKSYTRQQVLNVHSGKPGLRSPSTPHCLCLKADVPVCSPCRSRMSPLQNGLWQLTTPPPPKPWRPLQPAHPGVACTPGPSFALLSPSPFH